MIFIAFSSQAQFVLEGKVTASGNQIPLEGATIVVTTPDDQKFTIASTATGSYQLRLKKPGNYYVLASMLGYRTKELKVSVTQPKTEFDIQLEESLLFLEPLEVKATRAGDRAPFAKQNLSKAEIAKLNLGQDIPFLLNQMPSVVVNSDAGNGVGYTGIRIRGSDASRINVTLNGIPYNDAESQGTFFVDLPDFASSLQSVQVQRGVGTSSNGAGAFGATINLSTNEFNEKAYAEVNNSFGSFNTWKHTVKAGSGLLADHFTVDARLSKVSSDGYIDRASSDLRSFYISGAYTSAKSTLRLNIFSGTEKTYQSWYGVDSATLRNNRTFNPAGTEKAGAPYDNQTDNYQQDHYQLFFNHKLNNNWSFNTGFFLVNGKGYYEQYRAQNKYSNYGLPNQVIGGTTITRTDLVRQLWLDNSYYGQIASLYYKTGRNEITFGGGWNTYDGLHFGSIIWAQAGGIPKDYRWYNLPSMKNDRNVYGKWQHRLGSALQLFVDLQYRDVKYKTAGFRDNPTVSINRSFSFFNPKAGISYSKNNWLMYASYAVAQKEPNRDDFEAGTTFQPDPEILQDVELGIERKGSDYSLAANFYYMFYKDQLVLSGQINDVGAYTRKNAASSFRRGVELQGSKRFNHWLQATANLALSQNRISRFTEFIDDYDTGGQKQVAHTNKSISFSPGVVGGYTVDLRPLKHFNLALLGKYVSRQYLDNTENIRRSLDPYFTQDARLIVTIPNKVFSNLQLVLQANNVLNELYEPNGYTFSYYYLNQFTTENYYFPMAGRNYMVALNIRL